MIPLTKGDAARELILGARCPENTGSYVAVPHSRVIELTLQALADNGFELTGSYYLANKGGKQAIGKYFVRDESDPDMGLMVAWMNSYDKSRSLKWGIGARVFVCENGMLSADMNSLRHKHMGKIDTVTVDGIREYTKSARNTFREMVEDKERMKEVHLSKRVTAELVGRMFMEEKLISITQLGVIRRELQNPSVNYGAPGSLWELYNYTTFALKDNHPHTWIDRHMATHNFFVNKSGVLEPENTPTILEDALVD